MVFKRIITIIVVLLTLAGLLFAASWYVSRKNAEKSGTTPLTFREFLGIGTPALPGKTPGELTGEFTQPERPIKYDTNNNGINDWLEDINNNGIVDGNEDINNNGVLDGDEDFDNNGIPNREDTYIDPDTTAPDGGSINPDDIITPPGGFDTDPIMPGDGNPGGGTNPGDTAPPGGSVGGGDTSNPPGGNDFGDEDDVPPPDIFNPINDKLICSAEDINIVFTEAELARLKTLQARFDTIKSTLYDDAASRQQLSLYSNFKIKEVQVKELTLFCENTVSQISDPKMRRKVPTPFYSDRSRDAATFTNNPIVVSDYRDNAKPYKPTILNHPITVTTLLERLFRINIW